MNQTEKIKAGVIGATGYAGAELIRLLSAHPAVEIAAVSSISFEGQTMDAVYPNLAGICSLTLKKAEDVVAASDVVFTSLPHGLSEPIARLCIDQGKVLIDFGADFRLHEEAQYTKWYDGKVFTEPALHQLAVYSIPELHRSLIGQAPIIANPGCYPTSIALGLAPLMKAGVVTTDHIIVDSKSGVTGAGRSLTQGTHYPDTNEAFSAYKAGVHRHTPEIEQTLSELAGKPIKVTFVPHLLPVNRGIESSIYLPMKKSKAEIRALYEEFYKGERFVRLMRDGEYANIKNVRVSNYCDISLHFDAHTETLIVSSVIDNMVKGAAGQAIQNMNIRFGFEEAAGLLSAPPIF